MHFSWHDYLIFAFVLCFGAAVGIYFGCFARKQITVNRYLLGGKKNSPLPVALSVAVGHFSAVISLGYPSDVYKFGAYYLFLCVTFIFVALLTIYFYYSVFFNLQIISIYEYLEKRFDRKTRLLGSFVYILYDFLLLPIIAYGPSMAFSAATGINFYWVSSITCGVCIFYTAIGGLKTVIWTDIYQFVLVLAAFILILVMGIISAGGVTRILEKAVVGGRLDIFDLDLDPTRRDSTFIHLIGMTAAWLGHLSLSQGSIQKYLGLPTFKDCIRAVIYCSLATVMVIIFAVMIGLTMYGKYSDCDPVLSGKINKHYELVPFFVMDIAGNIPGFLGLFISSLFCASLSSISSSLNALSSVIYKDFLTRCLKANTKETTKLLILKCIVVMIGVQTICLSFVVEGKKDIISLAMSMTAISGGPSLGLFTLGVLFPFANSEGAFYGTVCGLIISAFMILPAKLNFFQLVDDPLKYLSVSGCVNLNQSLPNITTSYNIDSTRNRVEPGNVFFLFRISPFYHCLAGSIVTIIVGLGISYISNYRKQTPYVDKRLIAPISQRFIPKEIEVEASTELM